MIWESCYWKEPLLKVRKYLINFRHKENTSQKTLAEIEKNIFISFYSIRKLIEANKLSTINVHSKWSILSYQNISKVNMLDWDKIDEKYNLNEKKHEKKELVFICNQIIHSYVFVLDFDDYGKLSGFYISSDYERNKKLYFLQRREILEILKLIGSDYPAWEIRNECGESFQPEVPIDKLIEKINKMDKINC